MRVIIFFMLIISVNFFVKKETLFILCSLDCKYFTSKAKNIWAEGLVDNIKKFTLCDSNLPFNYVF